MGRAHADDNNILLNRNNSDVVDKLIDDRSLAALRSRSFHRYLVDSCFEVSGKFLMLMFPVAELAL